MRIIFVRRVSQTFFFMLFLWFCLTTSLGIHWWQLRGWPVNWFLQLDPLVSLGTLLTTHTIYKGLWWGVVTIMLTLVLGRFFCGWICPLGALQQLVGFLSNRKKKVAEKVKNNRYRKWQSIKYWLLVFLLTSGLCDLVFTLVQRMRRDLMFFGPVLLLFLGGMTFLALRRLIKDFKRALTLFIVFVAVGLLAGFVLDERRVLAVSLQSGLLDPLPLLYRSINLILMPLIDGSGMKLSVSPRFYHGAWLIGAIFIAIVMLNLSIPRFYCRFVCPLGALFGVLSRSAVWRIGKTADTCRLHCHLCEAHCEGACEPSRKIRSSECVLCFNCVEDCFNRLMTYQAAPSASGVIAAPDFSRRSFLVSLFSGAAAVPLVRLGGTTGPAWHPQLIRPPGALVEKDFLMRCIKCGQCMRICPTNVIQPDVFKSGLEGLWTPALDFRSGTSGCQINCIACGNLCPTGAIRSISLEERLGYEKFSAVGPIKIGTAFVDRGRCLPWAMDKPCIVCQENCPVSPKAIFIREHYQAIQQLADPVVKEADSLRVAFNHDNFIPGQFATGDFYCREEGSPHEPYRRIVKNDAAALIVSSGQPWEKPLVSGSRVEILIRLKRPYVDIDRCIGCGVCEHECPVKGKRAIRVTAENESRSREHALVLRML